MDARIRWFAIVFVACFCLLFLQLNNWQFRDASALRQNSNQPTFAGDLFAQPRGEILTADGVVLAKSVPSHDIYKELRVYPLGSLFADVTGAYDTYYHSDQFGLEAQYGGYAGYAGSYPYLRIHQTPVRTLHDILTQHSGYDNISITISSKLQQAAQQALDYPGAPLNAAVVAVDVHTGNILAMYGNPTYDPNQLASHNPTVVKAAYAADSALGATQDLQPLLGQPSGSRYPPGSTFKVIDTAAIFDHYPALAGRVWPVQTEITIPGYPVPFHNFGVSACGGNLAEILTVSCDTAYARIGLALGAKKLYEEAHAFGFDSLIPLDLPNDVATANFPAARTFAGNTAGVAFSAVGQENVSASALQMALVAAGIANKGVIMTPHLLNQVIDQQGQVVHTYVPHPWRRATSAQTAATVASLMLGPTNGQGGTLSGILNHNILPGGLMVAGKTGTAETTTGAGQSSCGADAWTIAFAPAGPGQVPKVAVAAVVPYENGQHGLLGCDTQGATTAAPIVRNVLLAALGLG
jgi:peptidoglycan glycosyltransferase